MQVLPFGWRTDVMLVPISCLSIPSSQCSRAVEILIVRVGRPFTTVIEARDSRSSVRWTTIWRWESSGSKELSSRSCSCFFLWPFQYCVSLWSLALHNSCSLPVITYERHFWFRWAILVTRAADKTSNFSGLSMRVKIGRYETAKFIMVTLTRLGGATKCREN